MPHHLALTTVEVSETPPQDDLRCAFPPTGGDYAEDCQSGRQFALDAVRAMAVAGDPTPMQALILGLPPPSSGVRVGFLTMIAELAIENVSTLYAA